MPIARLSGVVRGEGDPNRRSRAKMLYRLFSAGWDIYNGNGDQKITLNNIQKKIIESDAFVFTPGATLEDIFQAASIFVGFQTHDADLKGKPAVIHNRDNSWDNFIELIEHLHDLGTVSQHHNTFLTLTKSSRKIIEVLNQGYTERKKKVSHEPDILEESTRVEIVPSPVKKPSFNVCVFCSASIKKPDYLEEGYHLGKLLAKEGWGCVSGAGCTGIMGQVVKGSIENGGWAGGSNIPHIIALEGLPEGLCEFWPRADIYTRMEVMIENSNAFIVMPGGLGTVQEVLALIILKQQKNDLMRDKEIVIVNKPVGNGVGFWQPLLSILEAQGAAAYFSVVESYDSAITHLKNIK